MSGLIRSLGRANRHALAIQISRDLFEAAPSAQHLSTLIESVNNGGTIEERPKLHLEKRTLLEKCNIAFNQKVHSGWLWTVNTLIDAGRVAPDEFHKLYQECPEGDRDSSTFLVTQKFRRANIDCEFRNVIRGYHQLSRRVQENKFVRKQYEIACTGEECAPRSVGEGKAGARARMKDRMGVFVAYERGGDIYRKIKVIIEGATDAKIRSLRETGTPGSRTLIEQIEEQPDECRCALVLVTPDDLGPLANASPEESSKRAGRTWFSSVATPWASWEGRTSP